jgi:hypothetical protein
MLPRTRLGEEGVERVLMMHVGAPRTSRTKLPQGGLGELVWDFTKNAEMKATARPSRAVVSEESPDMEDRRSQRKRAVASNQAKQ